MLGLSSFQAPTSIVTDPVLSELLPEMTSLKLSGKDRAEERRVEEDKTEESENSGKAVTNMLKQVTISRKSRLNIYLD